MSHTSEYEVETLFIERLKSIGYKYVELKNYEDVLKNLRTQLAAFNVEKLMEKKGNADFSDLEFERIMIHMVSYSVEARRKLSVYTLLKT